MRKVIPLKLDFDYSLEREIPDDWVGFYRDLCEKLTGEPVEVLPEPTFIPASKDVDLKPWLLTDVLRQKYADYNSNGSESHSIFVFDLSNVSTKAIYRLALEFMLPALIEHSKQFNGAPGPRFVVLVESLYGAEAYDSIFSHFIESDSISIVGFNGGDAKWHWRSTAITSVTGFLDIFPRTPPEVLCELIATKLVRRTGHFWRKLAGTHLGCAQYFFDGKYCVSEISKLLNLEIARRYRGKSVPLFIIYHSPIAPWLKDAAILASNPFRKGVDLGVNIAGCSVDDEIESIYEEPCDVLFVVDLIHTGDTFRRVVTDTLRPKFPKGKITSISVLFTEKAQRDFPGDGPTPKNSIISAGMERIKVDWFVSVRQFFYLRRQEDGGCPMCKYRLLEGQSVFDKFPPQLNSYEMWHLANEASYAPEHVNSTRRREALRLLPDTLEMIRQNGAYFAYMFGERLEEEKAGFAVLNKTVVVFPDETKGDDFSHQFEMLYKRKPELEDTPSGLFATFLSRLLKYDAVGIPRDLIQDVQTGKLQPQDIRLRSRDLAKKLESLQANVVLTDEFFYEGHSLDKIMLILSSFSVVPKYYFPIFNFGGRSTFEAVKENGGYEQLKILTLYEFFLPKR